ncbi:pectinesterase inhibitor-like, partial [Olea europaea subsp. europaea]
MAFKSFLLVSLAVGFLYGCQADLVDEICSTSANSSFCNQILRSRGAKNLHNLGKIALDKALEATKATRRAVLSVGKGPTASTCVKVCQDAINNLNECRNLLKASDISTLLLKVSVALTDVETCDDAYGGQEPPQISQATQRANELI